MRKKIFIVLFIAIFSSMLGMGIIAPLMPIYAQKLGATGVWLGIIFSGFSLSRIIFMPIVGKLSDKKGRKIFISLGLFFYSLASLGYVWSASVYQLSLIRFLHGFASAMVLPIAMAYVGDISPEEREGKYLGTFSMALFLGMGFGPLLGGFLTDHFGEAAPFYTMGALSFLSLLFTLYFLPESFAPKHKLTKNPFSFKKVIKDNLVKALVVFRSVNAFGRGLIIPFLPVFAKSKGIGFAQIGILVSATILVSSVLQYPFGLLADKYSRIKLMLLGSLLGSIILFLIPFAGNFTGLLFLCLLVGVAAALGIPAGTALTAQIGKKINSMGAMMGIFSMSMSVGFILGPLTGGLIKDILNVRYTFYIGSIVGLIGSVVFYVLAKRD